jgi:hypothetical protein
MCCCTHSSRVRFRNAVTKQQVQLLVPLLHMNHPLLRQRYPNQQQHEKARPVRPASRPGAAPKAAAPSFRSMSLFSLRPSIIIMCRTQHSIGADVAVTKETSTAKVSSCACSSRKVALDKFWQDSASCSLQSTWSRDSLRTDCINCCCCYSS